MMNNRCSGCDHCNVCDIGIMEMNKDGVCKDWVGWRDDFPDLGELVLVKLNPRDCVVGYNDVEIAARVENGWVLGPFTGGTKVNDDVVVAWRKIIR